MIGIPRAIPIAAPTFMFVLIVTAPVTAAEPKTASKSTIESVCRAELAAKGYDNSYSVSRVDLTEARSNNSMSGQLQKGVKRWEFNCVLGKDMKPLDVVVNPLADAKPAAASSK